ncbi:early nodulin-93-like [Olea europaea subsp. europaea]|uniref:Early nodulin-93-like n=1 Tax=Olea europaea subsp. europaea TaxID=158383 RepID=A0A8S0PFC9_OLEEU|nr:early nodulin-93-like [Olea europaea subsp. europaea]
MIPGVIPKISLQGFACDFIDVKRQIALMVKLGKASCLVWTIINYVLVDLPLRYEFFRFRRDMSEGVRAGATAAAIASVASAVPTLIVCRTVPWAKVNLNYTAQALIISAASIAAYFITADKTILECARRNAQYDRSS